MSDLDAVDGESLLDATLALYDTGGPPKGDSTGWPSLDEFYTVAPGQVTCVTGMPGSGKSELLDAMLVNLWKSGRYEFGIHSPENWPVPMHLAKMMEKVTGKPFGDGPTARMTRREFNDSAIDFLQDVFWIEPKLRTPDKLIQTALAYRGKGKKLGIVLDPWNTLDHARRGMSETDYISYILTEVIKLARASNAHVWLVVHPSKLYRDKNGTRPVPTPYDIAGSSHWYNKLDNILTVHRDQGSQSQDVEVHVQKVRFKHIGRVGVVSLRWDRVTGRYFDAASAADYRRAANGDE